MTEKLSELADLIIDHQRSTRKALEILVSDLKSIVDYGRELSVLSTRVQMLEKMIEGIAEDSKKCRESMQLRINNLSSDIHSEQLRSYDAHKDLLNKSYKDYEVLYNRVVDLEKKAAELGGKYGASFGVISALFIEFIRWLISKHSGG